MGAPLLLQLLDFGVCATLSSMRQIVLVRNVADLPVRVAWDVGLADWTHQPRVMACAVRVEPRYVSDAAALVFNVRLSGAYPPGL